MIILTELFDNLHKLKMPNMNKIKTKFLVKVEVVIKFKTNIKINKILILSFNIQKKIKNLSRTFLSKKTNLVFKTNQKEFINTINKAILMVETTKKIIYKNVSSKIIQIN
jgi:hypothetical protein